MHINKYADHSGPMVAASVRVAGTEMERIAVTHHSGPTPESGHYSATVATPEGMTYYCNDREVSHRPNTYGDHSWCNGYLIFLRRTAGSDLHPAAANARQSADADLGSIIPNDDPTHGKTTTSCSDVHPAAEALLDADKDADAHDLDEAVEMDCGDDHPSPEPLRDDDDDTGLDDNADTTSCSDAYPAAKALPDVDKDADARDLVEAVEMDCGDLVEAVEMDCGDADSPVEPLLDDDDDDDTGLDDNAERDSDADGGGDVDPAAVPVMTATECRTTSTRHDDWLHRGPFLADLPWHVYMRRVRRARKPVSASADFSQLFLFDKHYALSALYCQELRYAATTAIPRFVGSVCPPVEQDKGEPHAAYKLMLFSRTRCAGPEHCADPLLCRPLLMPNDKPDDDNIPREKPRFWPCWKMCRCELETKAKIAEEKERRAQKIAVLADTTIMKDMKESSAASHSAFLKAFRLRPHLLKILATVFDKHTERMPQGIVELADVISFCLFGFSLYHVNEQLHLAEFAALDAVRMDRNMDMEILVRKKPFREEKQGVHKPPFSD